MRSETTLRILGETLDEVKEEVRRVTNLKIEKMHEVFTKMKSKKIQLDSEFWLMPDPYKGLILQREVEKSRKKIDKETKKPTGEEETYTQIEQHFFPRLSQTLNKYLELKSTEASSIEELKDLVLKVEEKINLIKESWN